MAGRRVNYILMFGSIIGKYSEARGFSLNGVLE